MYQVGNTVMHPSEGICAVEDIRRMRFGAQEREYYVLRPTMENSSSTVYLPVERGDAVLRKLLSREDILSMIRESAQYAGLWLDDSRLRKERFTEILHEGNYAKIIQMIRELHEHNARRLAEGKRPDIALTGAGWDQVLATGDWESPDEHPYPIDTKRNSGCVIFKHKRSGTDKLVMDLIAGKPAAVWGAGAACLILIIVILFFVCRCAFGA